MGGSIGRRLVDGSSATTEVCETDGRGKPPSRPSHQATSQSIDADPCRTRGGAGEWEAPARKLEIASNASGHPKPGAARPASRLSRRKSPTRRPLRRRGARSQVCVVCRWEPPCSPRVDAIPAPNTPATGRFGWERCGASEAGSVESTPIEQIQAPPLQAANSEQHFDFRTLGRRRRAFAQLQPINN